MFINVNNLISISVCCFVLLVPMGHRIQTVSAFTSVAGYAGPSSSLQTTPESPVLLSEVQSGVQHLLGLISGLRRGGRGIPISSLVVEMDRVVSVVFGLWRVCFPPCLVRPDRRRLVYFSIAHRRGGRSLEAIQLRKHKFLPCK